MKRIVLFLATNLAVVLVLSLTLRLLGVDRFLSERGLDLGALLVFSLVVGFGGSLVSLLISRPVAKWSTGARVIDPPQTPDEAWLVATVHRLAQQAGIDKPEVALYPGAPNAFATGRSRDASLVAVSSGLLAAMKRQEIEAVLGHEVSHVANGDMVTLALIQGVVNTFVVFLARVVGSLVDGMLARDDDRAGAAGPGYFVTVFVCEIVFGIGASIIVAGFSRRREFRADAGSARLLGSPAPMISALVRLGAMAPGALPPSLRAFGIEDRPARISLFASHPPLAERIAALEAMAAAPAMAAGRRS
ncbi:MAG TPA: protease HtpX [Caldimonas sp.]|nr:protease HtpX [Caldimonas sp.]HEV7574622.1 protease HtpX [Caldimonas sp.]